MAFLGIDTGGTFTDFVVFDLREGGIQTFKVRSTPEDPGRAVEQGLARLEQDMDLPLDRIDRFIFGTTVATNAVLERKGAATALITTKGLRDVLEIQRQWRYRLFDLSLKKPEPLAPRRHRLDCDERVMADGTVLQPLEDEEIDRLVDQIAALPVEAVAISFIFSFLRPDHEKRVADALRHRRPDLAVTLSSEVCPEFREFERSATTVMNAYTMPKISQLAERLTGLLDGQGFQGQFGMIQSNGGIMDLEKARRLPVATLLSGPAAGVVGAVEVARSAGEPNLIAFDVGGTSTDIALVEGGQVGLSSMGGIGGHPVKLPQVKVHTIGAGGGSLAKPVLGVLKVGPESAGADPGPACYGAGGDQPTGSDAALLLGYLDPEGFLDGEMALDRNAAERAVMTQVATPLGLSLDEAAHAIMRVQVSNIIAGIRKVSIEAGKDPRDFTLMPFGGAGGLFAGLLAEEAGLKRMLFPQHPSVLSALGMLMTDVRHDRATTLIAPLDRLRSEDLAASFAPLAKSLWEQLKGEGYADDGLELEAACDLRYIGQAYEITVSLGDFEKPDATRLRQDFDEAHARLYGQASPQEPVELVACRVSGKGHVAHAHLKAIEVAKPNADPTPVDYRPLLFDPVDGWQDCPLFRRADLLAGQVIEGPALIEDRAASIPLRPGHRLRVDPMGHLLVTLPDARPIGGRHE